MDCHRGRGSGSTELGMAEHSRCRYGITLLEEVAINPTIELLELTQDWGNRLLEGTNRTCVHQDPGERSSDPTRN